MPLRNRVWIDRPVQGVLIGRVILYWICGLTYVGVGSACFQYYQHPDWTFSRHWVQLLSQWGPWLPCIVLVMPLVVFDVLRLSNLFAGPIYRLRQHLSQLTENLDDCPPLKFRKDDYWQDLVKPINGLQSEIIALRQEVAVLRKRAQFIPDPAEVAAAAKLAATPDQETDFFSPKDTSEKPLLAET